MKIDNAFNYCDFDRKNKIKLSVENQKEICPNFTKLQ